jgi:DNA-binding HxlR family transcriptional regulator
MTDSLTASAPLPSHAAALEAIDTLDDTLNQKARMKIMTTLLALGEADFKLLKEELALSDGNLSTHLALLEERGYVEARKEFVRRKPHSSYKPTENGRVAFHRYIDALMRIVRAAGSVETPEVANGLPERQDTPSTS